MNAPAQSTDEPFRRAVAHCVRSSGPISWYIEDAVKGVDFSQIDTSFSEIKTIIGNRASAALGKNVEDSLNTIAKSGRLDALKPKDFQGSMTEFVRQVAQERVVGLAVRRCFMDWLVTWLSGVAAQSWEVPTFQHKEHTDEAAIELTMKIRGKSYSLWIGTHNELRLHETGPWGPENISGILSLCVRLGLFPTPKERFDRIRRSAELSAHEPEWTKTVDTFVLDSIRNDFENESAENLLREYDTADDWRLTVALGIPKKSKEEKKNKSFSLDVGWLPDVDAITEAHENMQRIFGADIPPTHPLSIVTTFEFIWFITRDSRLFWLREHILAPFFRLLRWSRKCRGSKHLPLLVREHGLEKRTIPETRGITSLVHFIIPRKKDSGIFRLKTKSFEDLWVLVGKIFTQFHIPPDQRSRSLYYQDIAKNGSRSESETPSYAQLLIQEPINSFIETSFLDAYEFFGKLYDSDLACGWFDPQKGGIRVPDEGYCMGQQTQFGTIERIGSMVTAAAKREMTLYQNPDAEKELLKTGRVGLNDFCLLMFAQAFQGANVSKSFWYDTVERIERISKTSWQGNGPALLDRYNLPEIVQFKMDRRSWSSLRLRAG